ncbi:hypothetical protein GCM10010990_36820 [Croceicoccus mobilis]|uniref:Uncharacterized protein n=1 Tax=Croceicoccus mobilis TaxID=1703339 RepID=A0A916ZA46_9SPHN|nr:hypothetical protein GCM10010990_36820 [Croceicoccus mobilis]
MGLYAPIPLGGQSVMLHQLDRKTCPGQAGRCLMCNDSRHVAIDIKPQHLEKPCRLDHEFDPGGMDNDPRDNSADHASVPAGLASHFHIIAVARQIGDRV